MATAKVLVRTAGMDRATWLAWRRRGIGGSDAPAVAGLDPLRSPLALWMEKTGQMEPEEPGESALWGTLLEPVIVEEWERRTGKKARRRNAILQHPEQPFMLANLDREVVGERALLEIKTTAAWHGHEIGEDRLPDRYVVQAQHYLAVTGYERCYFAVLVGGQHLVTTYVDRDEELISYLVEMERDFWRCVETCTPPAPGGSDLDRAILQRLYPDVEPDSVVDLPEEAAEWLRVYREAHAAERAATARKQEAANRLRSLLGGHELGRIGGEVVVRQRQIMQKRLDTKRLKSERPDVYDAYLTEAVQRRLEVLGGNEEGA
ncbi:phage-type endonuclease [Thermaerobacter marianensis DSM 12885]|uniref:Phage-type endonuclease n=1 Tax=Thermaerobacter marianensis (strain ATCC 700841 / DSM 12885 / JCM 10246 / 7p75a) TaxID=644966 RepID=E6SKF9_THEM7|nr:YqaJ viral recombinase family protein [Thermaerobacter marianensis]ADU50146.1 phage-type endonuclease [Thermaerobacter marianensis DSM 12885]